MKRHLFLITLLLAALVSPVFAATVSTTVEFGQVAQYTEQSYDNAGVMANGEARTLVIYSGGTNTTGTLTPADDDPYNTKVGSTKLGNTGNKGSNLETLDGSGHKKYFVKFSAVKDEQVRLYYFHASLPKVSGVEIDQADFVNNTFNLSHKTNGFDAEIPGVDGTTLTLRKIYYVDFTILEDGIYYISVNGGSTSVNVSGIKFSYEQSFEEVGELIVGTYLTGETTFDATGWYIDPTKAVVKTKATNSNGTDITATHQDKKGYCINGKGNYVGVAVSGTTFQEGDVLNVFVTKVPSQGSLAIYADIAGAELIYDTQSYGVLGNNQITLPAAANGKTVLYVTRTDANTWNGRIYSVEVRRADIPYQMLFGYTWIADALSTATNAEFDMTTTGLLRAGSAIKGVSGATGALTRTATDGVNMLALNKKDNYIELAATENLQDGDEIEILGRAGSTGLRGLYIEPTTVTEYFNNSATALETNKVDGQAVHTSYTATVTEEWLATSGVTNTIRIFCNGNNIAVERINIIRHQRELADQTVVSGTINGATTDMTSERIEKLNTGSHTFSMNGAYHATIVLNVQQTYMLDGEPANTRVITKEITLTEGEIAADGSTPYTATVGEITYKVTLRPYTASDVTSGRTWTWSNFTNTTDEMTSETSPALNTEFVMASVTGKENGAQYLTIAGQFAVTEKKVGTTNDKVKCFVGNVIKFTTTVPGIVRAIWVSNGTSERVLTINGIATAVSSSATTDEYITTEDIYVEAGEVVIQCALTDGTSSKQYFRLTELKFQTVEFVPVREGLTEGKVGTICLKKSSNVYRGADFYRLVSKTENPDDGMIFEEVSALERGRAYVFVATASTIECVLTGTEAANPVAASKNNGLQGTFELMEAGTFDTEDLFGIQNGWISPLSAEASVPAGRAYIVKSKVPDYNDVAPVSGRRLVIAAPAVATSLNEQNDAVVARKVLRDGKILIIRGEKCYTVQGMQIH